MPPFRHTLHAPPAEQISTPEYIRTMERIFTPDAFRDPEQLDELKEVAQHPTELVPYTLLSLHFKAPGMFGIRLMQREPGPGLFVQRALSDADREGLVWTPMLDLVARHALWSEPTHGPALLGEGAPSPQARIAPLATWIAAQESVEALDPFLTFRSPAARSLALEHARVLTPARLIALLDRPVDLSAVIRNPHLSTECCHAISEWAWGAQRKAAAAMTSAQSGHSHAAETAWRAALLALLEDLARRPSGLSAQVRTAMLGAERGWRMADFDSQRILAADRAATLDDLVQFADMMAEEAAPELLAHPLGGSDEVWAALKAKRGRFVRIAAVVLQKCPHLPAERVKDAVESASFSQFVLLAAICHPNAGPAIWEHALKDTSPTVREALAADKRARHHAPVRSALMRSVNLHILGKLIRDCDQAEYPRLFRSLAKVNPRTALRELRDRPIPPGTRIPRADLLPLFTQLSAEARTDSLRILAKLEEAERAAPELAEVQDQAVSEVEGGVVDEAEPEVERPAPAAPGLEAALPAQRSAAPSATVPAAAVARRGAR
jgi:hypothetical protein